MVSVDVKHHVYLLTWTWYIMLCIVIGRFGLVHDANSFARIITELIHFFTMPITILNNIQRYRMVIFVTMMRMKKKKIK